MKLSVRAGVSFRLTGGSLMNKKSITRSAEQERAGYALSRVNDYSGKDSDWKEKYASYVKSLPATILMCGLGQGMAFLLAKSGKDKGEPHGRLYSDIEGWLCGKEEIFPEKSNLMDALTKTDMNTYLQAQAEALSLLVWLKKFATAFLGKAGGTGD